MTLLPSLGPGVAEGFAAGTLLSATCLLIVIALQRAGWPRVGPPRSFRLRQRARPPARGGGKHAARTGGSTRLAGRRRSRLLTTRD